MTHYSQLSAKAAALRVIHLPLVVCGSVPQLQVHQEVHFIPPTPIASWRCDVTADSESWLAEVARVQGRIKVTLWSVYLWLMRDNLTKLTPPIG